MLWSDGTVGSGLTEVSVEVTACDQNNAKNDACIHNYVPLNWLNRLRADRHTEHQLWPACSNLFIIPAAVGVVARTTNSSADSSYTFICLFLYFFFIFNCCFFFHLLYLYLLLCKVFSVCHLLYSTSSSSRWAYRTRNWDAHQIHISHVQDINNASSLSCRNSVVWIKTVCIETSARSHKSTGVRQTYRVVNLEASRTLHSSSMLLIFFNAVVMIKHVIRVTGYNVRRRHLPPSLSLE